MVQIIVQLDSDININKVKEIIRNKYPKLNYITECHNIRSIIYRFNKETTNNVINNIKKIQYVNSVTIDEFNYYQCF